MYTVGDLEEGGEYEFRVLAENPVGLSKPSASTGILTAKDPYGKCLIRVLKKHCVVCLCGGTRILTTKDAYDKFLIEFESVLCHTEIMMVVDPYFD